jgi:O-antigen/teichoic acid export membrane protein
MKIVFIIVTCKTKKSLVENLENEIRRLKLEDYKVYIIDNSKNNKGFASGVNKGIKKGLKEGGELFVVANPDISIRNIKTESILEAGKQFDIWGLAMNQADNVYYGGKIDKWRMSGGLIAKKPRKRFTEVDYVTGSLMFIKRKVIEKIELLPEEYFMYYEDVDYCLKAKNAGFRVGIDSSLTYEHFEHSNNYPEKEYLLAKNRFKFFFRYSSLAQKIYELARIPKTIWEEKGLLKNIVLKNSFLINFFSLNLSSLAIKLLNLILFIFLIRFLSPAEYGVYTLVWAGITILTPFMDFGTTSYGFIDLPRENKQRFATVFNLRLFLSILVFMLTLAILPIAYGFKQNLITYGVLTSFVIFSNMLSGSFLILTALQQKIYFSSTVSAVFNLVLSASLIASLILWKSLTAVFVTIFTTYNLYSVLNYLLIKKTYGSLRLKFDTVQWLKIVKKSYIYVLLSIFAGLYFKIDVFLLKALKSEKEVGIYSAGYKFFEALIFIAASYTATATPIFAKLVKNNTDRLVNKLKKDIILLSFIGTSIAIITLIFSPHILPILMKGSYAQSIMVVRITIFALPLILIASMFYNVLYVLDRAYLVVAFYIFQTIFNFGLNFVFIPKYSYIASAYITVISEVISVIFGYYLVRKYLISAAYEKKKKKNSDNYHRI